MIAVSTPKRRGRPFAGGSCRRLKGANYRLVVPSLTYLAGASQEARRDYRADVLRLLLHRQRPRGLQYYHVALEGHRDGTPHLDVLLIYSHSVVTGLTRFDYLGKHGDLTKYRLLNEAIVKYGRKQDEHALSNLPQAVSVVTSRSELRRDPYAFLAARMRQDPFKFDVTEYCQRNGFDTAIRGWTSVRNKVRDFQAATCNARLRQRPGFRQITRGLVQQVLTPAQLAEYDGWPGYARIVHHLNQVCTCSSQRDPKAMNLLLTGPPNCGKSALVWHPSRTPSAPYNPLSSYVSIYPMGMKRWFPPYSSGVYSLIYWNEAKLTSYPYDTVLKLLDGSPMDLDTKGSTSRKVDNPLILMTSNMTLEEMICRKFLRRRDRQLARSNLAVRVQNVVVPQGRSLFLLQRLLLPAEG